MHGERDLSSPLRQRLGCWLHERWRTELALGLPSWAAASLKFGWLWLCNRNERVLPGDEGAMVCDWEFSNLLTVARIFPKVGGRLLKRCLNDWPVRIVSAKESILSSVSPQLSVIFPVGGSERRPLFEATVASFRGQTAAGIELIAVEHSSSPEYADVCAMQGVRYLHIPGEVERAFNKSLAMNVGVSLAQAKIVLLHDADVLVPTRYVESLLDAFARGWEAVRPIRLLFLLDREMTGRFLAGSGSYWPETVAEIQANNPGLSTAVRTEVYWRIGGHDESFEGWGGEDAEFLQRLNSVRLLRGGFCPGIHLWHKMAQGKDAGGPNRQTCKLNMYETVTNRIKRLNSVNSKYSM